MYYIIVTILSFVIAANSLLQVNCMKHMHARQVASLKMAREGNAMAREGMKSISAIYEIDKITGEIEKLAQESDRLSTGVTLDEMKILRTNGHEAQNVWNKLVQSNSQGSLVIFLRSLDLGKKNLVYGKTSLRNAEILMDTMRWVNTQWPAIIKNTEAMDKLTDEYIKIMKDSKDLSKTMLDNTRRGNQKLQRFIKYFRRIKKEKEKQNTEAPPAAPGT